MGVAYEKFIEALQSSGYKVQHHGRDRARAACPGHGGTDLNLSIAIGDQGVLLKDHSYDCPAEDIAKGVGLTLEDLFDADGKATYDYGGGHRVTRKRTRDGKQIFQSNKPTVTSLYRHPMSAPIETSPVVVLVEGEKCVDAALRLGEACVTTWPGGVAGVDHVDLSPLAGKSIRIIADNDEVGRRAGYRLIARLEGLATVEGIWVVPGEKRGVDDLWLEGGTLAELEAAEPPATAEPDQEAPRAVALTKLSSVKSRRPRFLWEGVMPLGNVTLWGGRGGVSKSTFAIERAGRITKGTLPGDLFGKPSPVLYVSHEDSLEEVIALRCAANDVDTDLFYQLGIRSKELGGITVPRLPEDMPLLRDAIAQTGAKVIIIDPITSTIGGDNDKMLDVRAVMDPLNQLGIELGVSIIAIAHFKKGAGAQSDLISGSHAYRDASRCVILFARDEEYDGQTVITIDKSNYGITGHSFAYTTEIIDLMTDEGSMATVGKINWQGESERSVGDIVNSEQRGTKPSAAKAIMAIMNELTGGVTIRTEQILEELVPEFSASACHKALGELKRAGKITSPIRGLWRLAHEHDEAPPRAHARGGEQGVITVSELEGRSTNISDPLSTEQSNIGGNYSNTVITPIPPTRVREVAGMQLCRICGYPLPDAVVADGETAHPSCDR